MSSNIVTGAGVGASAFAAANSVFCPASKSCSSAIPPIRRPPRRPSGHQSRSRRSKARAVPSFWRRLLSPSSINRRAAPTKRGRSSLQCTKASRPRRKCPKSPRHRRCSRRSLTLRRMRSFDQTRVYDRSSRRRSETRRTGTSPAGRRWVLRRMSQKGGEAYFARNRMTAMARTPVLPEATLVGPLSALLRHSPRRRPTIALDPER
jgi:hypothetical protein